jgi:hypothetical protein
VTINTIPANDRFERFTANAGQTVFSFNFPVFDAADLRVTRRRAGTETVLSLGADYLVTGQGQQQGGSITLTVPAEQGDVMVLASAQPVERAAGYTHGGPLPAASLNADFNRVIVALQQIATAVQRTIRQPDTDTPDGLLLPTRTARANRRLGFDAAGDLALYVEASQGSAAEVVALGSTVARSLAERFADRVNVRDHGAVPDGVTDSTAAINAAAAYAASTGRILWFPTGTYATTGPVTVAGGARGVIMDGEIKATGGYAALTIGDGGTTANQCKLYGPLRVFRATQSDWSTELDRGIVLRNCDACLIEVARAEGFTIGVQTVGDGRGFEDSTLILGRIVNNQIGLDVRTLQASGWNNSVRYIGGHFANAASVNPTLPRFGVRFSAANGAYVLHNAHTFLAPAFELQRQGTPGTVDAIPFLLQVDGRGLHAYGVRMEQCSPFVARHTGAFNDATYEVEYVGTYGFTGAAVQYLGATRAGGASIPRHQAAAAIASPRLVAAVPDVRAAAYQSTVVAAGGIGFEGLAVLSANPSGPPTTLNGFCFDGLASITLNTNDVTLPTSRALAFVVDCSRCKEFVLAAEGTELRPIIMQFDASENVLTNAAPVLMSNMNVTWVGTNATWWEGAGDLDGLTGGIALNRHQRVTLHDSAAFAVIGVRGSSANAKVRAMRLFCDALQAPRVLAGGTRTWGTREWIVSNDITINAIAAGDSGAVSVTAPLARQGDFIQVSFAKNTGFQNGGIQYSGVVGGSASSGEVVARFTNLSNGTITLGDGRLFVRGIRPRL